MLSSDNNGIATVPTTMAPGNSFLPIVGIIVYNSSVDAQQMLLSAKVTATASTSTASWTFTTSHAPLTSVLAFGPAPISFVGYPVIY